MRRDVAKIKAEVYVKEKNVSRTEKMCRENEARKYEQNME